MHLRTHGTVGAVIGLWISGPIGGALGAFTGTVPDVDLDTGSVARVARWLGRMGIAGGIIGGYLLNSLTIAGLAIAGGFILLMLIRLPHRGPTHSLALAFLWSLLGGLWLQDPGLIGAWAGGYLSHLFLDALTPHGIPWLWPMSDKRLRLARWRTGSLWDHGILIVSGLIGVGWIGWKMVG
ncbi:MAG: metal-dependent hydrolase [Anaerolineae bacterium]|nr:metal-dependent hydrolase [Thermoflexus sp.]MDW8064880.1 metal-dependent hydrolase [Anaerolineae bacterium]